MPCDVVLTGRAIAASPASWQVATGCRRVYPFDADAGGAAGLRPLVAALAGRSLALVLSGGGARALAHLGILHALEDAGVIVERVAGSSLGALIAAAYATGASAADVDRVVFDEVVVGQPFGDWRLSTESLARGGRLRSALQRTFGDARLETLPRELVVVSTDLYARAPVYHRQGLVVDALAASMSLPVLFPPVHLDGRFLVDGSLSDHCPVGAFAEPADGPVLAVRIAAPSPPAGGRVPGLGDALLQVIEMGSAERDGHADIPAAVTVTPDTRGIGPLEFHQIDAARDAGRRAGEAAIAALRHAGILTGPD